MNYDSLTPKGSKNRKYLKYALFGLVLVALVAFYPSGKRYASKRYNDFLDEQKKELRDSVNILLEENELIRSQRDSLSVNNTLDQQYQYNYYNDFLRERRKNKRYEALFNEIRLRRYDRAYLDSLAKHVKFR